MMQPGGALQKRPDSHLADVLAVGLALLLLAAFFVAGGREFLTDPRHTLVVLGITSVFALIGRFTRGVNTSGAIAGACVAFILAIRDLRLFEVLLLVFVVTLAVTRLGVERKRALRTAETSAGRTASQVMANLGIAAFIVALSPQGWAVLALAALAEAAADTASSEVGMAFPGSTVLISSWKPVSPGVDGGVSFFGSLAAIAAAVTVAGAAMFSGLVTLHHAIIVAIAATLGSLVDSLLGALLERRGHLNNDVVNLLSTAAAIGLAWVAL